MDVTALPKRQEPDAVELALENPFRPSETFLRQGRCHWLKPLGEGHEQDYDPTGGRVATFCRRSWRFQGARICKTEGEDVPDLLSVHWKRQGVPQIVNGAG